MTNVVDHPVHLAEHDVERSDQRDDVGDQVALDQRAQPLQVAERRRPHAEPVRVGRLAVADDEVAELALGRLDRVIGLAGRRLDQPRHLADDRPFGQPFGRLPDDPQRLAELLDPHQVAVVGVAGGADRHVELHLVVGGVRLVLADVARHARAAQRRAAQPEGDRVRPGRSRRCPWSARARCGCASAAPRTRRASQSMILQNSRTFLSQPGGMSSGRPPMRIEL